MWFPKIFQFPRFALLVVHLWRALQYKMRFWSIRLLGNQFSSFKMILKASKTTLTIGSRRQEMIDGSTEGYTLGDALNPACDCGFGYNLHHKFEFKFLGFLWTENFISFEFCWWNSKRDDIKVNEILTWEKKEKLHVKKLKLRLTLCFSYCLYLKAIFLILTITFITWIHFNLKVALLFFIF